ncbi:heme-binding protein [Thiomicrorhabdus sp. zzn3]|uniref:GlcG/HbpS family heme-binding protein n=1 Tax=Thiomicrorhabdus sp. zzn3 TaxID=3039775 RepID=UPI002436CABB|nr:heme-binding protein [Thiomicrorhabdus sp. zzn3]MDG6779050.1 heme-binding protein [Thiomicrorhabdus sp. zzn3]
MLKSKIKKGLLTLAAATVMTTPVMAEEPMAVNIPRLSMDVANTIAVNTIKACREKGIPVSVTVVDRNGIVQAQLRDTIAPPVSLSISNKKAYTAVMFNVKGSQLGDRANSPLQTMGEGLAFMAGSTPIQAGGKLYGAVGVSGAPDGMDDEACAVAGVESVQDDLEMM